VTAVLIFYSFYMNLKILKHGEPTYSERINAIYDGAKTDSFHRLNYQVYGVLRRVYLALILIFLKDQTNLQIVAYVAQSLLFTSYMLSY
jgi:hypothetical protein